ncbi:MAG: hypothetical protein V4565_06285 [Bacteroidota bacterium]
MKYIIFLSLALFSFSLDAQQSTTEAQLFQTRLSMKITTLKINVAGCTGQQLINLKAEYQNWSNKISSISMDQQNLILSIAHNGLWQKQEIYEMLEKYNISKSKIISDK